MASSAIWLRRLVDLVDELSFAEVPTRIARHLLRMAHEGGVEIKNGARVDLPMTKTDFARLLGTVSETLSRVLARLVDDGLLTVDGRTIILADVEALRELAER
ncbi:MAG: helix-turn-helix domain-containing protein [Deltaproteobacteria bacterium]|nr:helix-turn-helix domain-containing protein [Deltaproteobacteria bacterium]